MNSIGNNTGELLQIEYLQPLLNFYILGKILIFILAYIR